MIKVAICDDELSAIQNLKKQISSFFLQRELDFLVFEFEDGETLLKQIFEKKQHFDLIFLDIQMNTLNGMDVAKSIRQSDVKDVSIVFVTALKEYVFDAFEVSASNYLVKPIEQQKLEFTLKKIISELIPAKNKYLIMHKAGQMKKIAFCEIMYCEVVGHRVFIYEKHNTHEYGGKIDDLERQLNDNFFRCHRSYIVNLEYVNSYQSGVAFMPSEEKVPVATRRQADFMKALLLYQRKEVR